MRYLLLIALNLPIILLALVNFITQYKLKKIDSRRFRQQIVVWIVLLLALLLSFPAYNLLTGKPIFQSDTLTLFDVVQTTAIIYIVYGLNNLRRKNEHSERLLRELHQELSIKLSTQNEKK